MKTSYIADQSGRLTCDVDLPAGVVRVMVDPDADRARVTVSTTAESGPAPDLVAAARFTETPGRLAVRLPEPDAGGIHQTVIGDGYGGVSVVQSAGVVFGTVSGVVVDGAGIMHVGGNVAGGNLTVIGRTNAFIHTAPVVVQVVLPPGCCLVARTRSADVLTFGDLAGVDAKTMSGDIHVGGVQTPRLETMSGDISIRALTGDGRVKTMSGDIQITTTDPVHVSAQSMSGDITVDGPVSDLDARSMSGRVRTRV